ncbi:MFS transporter [Sulfobacillus thermosulfidooxidans]|uniref:MFS transporter n=1 Tax=Sulfobacillus thermosulfidooxidans TaxID=28034 RepID=UPI00178CCBEA|nr:MFS transporter [Sulfobacillus thermosulfidooxidans]
MPVSQNLKWLYANRALRSFATAFLTVIFPLYLAVSGYSAARIGMVLTLSGIISVLLLAGVGIFGDKVGRKRAIIILSLLSFLGSLVMATSRDFWFIVLASGLGGVGKGGGAGSGGSWGPLFPAEQPLLAEAVSPENRTKVFGRISFVGVLAGALGSLVAAVPELLHEQGISWQTSYQLLFGFSAVLSIFMVMVAWPIRESRSPHAMRSPEADESVPINVKQLTGRLGLTNALNGLGFGFLGPLLTYWFYRRYGAGPAELGTLYTIINLATAMPYLLSSKISQYLGAVRAVTYTRTISIVWLALMPFMPTFWLAGLSYLLRMVFNSLGMPARQSYAMGVADKRYRSRVAAFSNLPSQLTSMLSPVIGGSEMESFLDFPIYGAVFFMTLNVLAYYFAFRHIVPPEEQNGPHPTRHLTHPVVK